MIPLGQVTAAAAPAVSAAALVAGALTLLVTRRPVLAIGVLLDLLVAAGLLRLSGDPGWREVLTVAAVVALRHLVTTGLRSAARNRSGGDRGPGRRPVTPRRLHLDRLARPAWLDGAQENRAL